MTDTDNDVVEYWRAVRDIRRERRAALGVPCPLCKVARPRATPSLLLPGQRCRVDRYRDPRPDDRVGDDA